MRTKRLVSRMTPKLSGVVVMELYGNLILSCALSHFCVLDRAKYYDDDLFIIVVEPETMSVEHKFQIFCRNITEIKCAPQFLKECMSGE